MILATGRGRGRGRGGIKCCCRAALNFVHPFQNYVCVVNEMATLFIDRCSKALLAWTIRLLILHFENPVDVKNLFYDNT
jgi:hypothetical protein